MTPPTCLFTPCHFLRGDRHRPDQSHFLKPRACLLGNGRSTVSRVLFRRRELTEPHWVSGQTWWVLRKTRWVRFGTQIIGWEELTELAPRNSVSPKKLTEFGVWNRALRNRIRPVSDLRSPPPVRSIRFAPPISCFPKVLRCLVLPSVGFGKRSLLAKGSKTVFGEGFYGMFSPPLSFPPRPCWSLKLTPPTVSRQSLTRNFAAQNRESRIARFPESLAWNRQKFRTEKHKKEPNCRK